MKFDKIYQNLGSSLLKIWLFPSICFVLFLYGMVFLIIYSYDDKLGQINTPKKEIINEDAIKRELKKI